MSGDSAAVAHLAETIKFSILDYEPGPIGMPLEFHIAQELVESPWMTRMLNGALAIGWDEGKAAETDDTNPHREAAE